MSNPGSPAVPSSSGSALSHRQESKGDNGGVNDNEEVSDGQMQSVKKKPSTGILAKSKSTVTSNTVADNIKIKTDVSSENLVGVSSPSTETVDGAHIPVSITPSIVKPRRPSVHFAVDSESKMKTISLSERSRTEGGGSRKHRSRKEKLVCRSESPSDLGMDASENRKLSGAVLIPSSLASAAPSLGVTTLPSTPVTLDFVTNKKIVSSSLKINPPIGPPPSRGTPTGINSKVKSRVKKVSSGNAPARAVGSRKHSTSTTGNVSPAFREPLVKKKKVIEIVSPRKRKMDHMDLVKTSSDPIFIRAANKPFKFKNKPQHNRFKFSRVTFNRSRNDSSGQRQQVRRTSLSSFQQGSGIPISKQRLVIGSPMKKEPDVEPPCFPASLMNDLRRVLEDAEKEFSPERVKNKTKAPGTSSSHCLPSRTAIPKTVLGVDSLTGASAVARKLTFARRRVESEPPGTTGFEMPPTPGSPSTSQHFYPIRKEVYFSPSPSYAATGPAGRRRYSRRRHARIHPPFEDTNCFFQGHHCSNSKVPGSQFCEKHLDQGPTSGFSYCKYLKDGRQCGSLFPSFDSTMTFCEHHAHQIAKVEYELRNPKILPDATKNILAQISKICSEDFLKSDIDNTVDTSASSIDILQVIDEPELIQDLPLGNFDGGRLEEMDVEGERNVNPDKPDYEALKNAGYFTTEEIIQVHIHKLRKLKALYQREKELEWHVKQNKLRYYKDGLERLKQCAPKITTNPYLISRNIELPKDYIEHQFRQYEATKAILQTSYKTDGEKGLLRLKLLQKSQELARMAKARGQKQHDTVDICDSESDLDSDSGDSRDCRDSSRYTGSKSIKCAYNEGYAIRACQNPPVFWSNYCFKHILSDSKQVQWVPCNRRIGPDPQDTCKTPCLRILQKHGCAIHAPLVMSKHKPLRRSEEELNLLVDSENEEEEVTLEGESQALASLVSDECISVSHVDEVINQLVARGSMEVTDTSDSEETDEEIGGGNLMSQLEDDDTNLTEQIHV